MDIQEMQERKKSMEKAIAAAIQDFENAAGVTVGAYVNVDRLDVSAAGERRSYIITARTEVTL